jgi:hypothetical protein
VSVPDILDSDHLPTVFHILDHVKSKNLLEPAAKFIDWECFQNCASDLISPRIEINSKKDDNKAAHNFTASVTSAYRPSTGKVSFSDIHNHALPGLHHWLKHRQKL